MNGRGLLDEQCGKMCFVCVACLREVGAHLEHAGHASVI